jgi:hypothetical protein
MNPIEPNQPLTVTLDANEWNNVLAALNEAPHRVASPLIRKIVAAIETYQSTSAPVTEAEHIPARRNGKGPDHNAA